MTVETCCFVAEHQNENVVAGRAVFLFKRKLGLVTGQPKYAGCQNDL